MLLNACFLVRFSSKFPSIFVGKKQKKRELSTAFSLDIMGIMLGLFPQRQKEEKKEDVLTIEDIYNDLKKSMGKMNLRLEKQAHESNKFKLKEAFLELKKQEYETKKRKLEKQNTLLSNLSNKSFLHAKTPMFDISLRYDAVNFVKLNFPEDFLANKSESITALKKNNGFSVSTVSGQGLSLFEDINEQFSKDFDRRLSIFGKNNKEWSEKKAEVRNSDIDIDTIQANWTQFPLSFLHQCLSPLANENNFVLKIAATQNDKTLKKLNYWPLMNNHISHAWKMIDEKTKGGTFLVEPHNKKIFFIHRLIVTAFQATKEPMQIHRAYPGIGISYWRLPDKTDGNQQGLCLTGVELIGHEKFVTGWRELLTEGIFNKENFMMSAEDEQKRKNDESGYVYSLLARYLFSLNRFVDDNWRRCRQPLLANIDEALSDDKIGSVQAHCHKINSLIFQGGGVKGTGHLGAISYFVENGLIQLKQIKRAAGTSAGALTALLVSLGKTHKEIIQITHRLDFNGLLDEKDDAFPGVNPKLIFLLIQKLLDPQSYSKPVSQKYLHKILTFYVADKLTDVFTVIAEKKLGTSFFLSWGMYFTGEKISNVIKKKLYKLLGLKKTRELGDEMRDEFLIIAKQYDFKKMDDFLVDLCTIILNLFIPQQLKSNLKNLKESNKHSVEKKDSINLLQEILGKINDQSNNPGLFTGKKLADKIKFLIKSASLPVDITFFQLAEKSRKNSAVYKELFVTAFDLEKKRTKIFSAIHTPNAKVWQAVRASTAIPYFFQPEVIEINGIRKPYADGGVLDNCPATIFDENRFRVDATNTLDEYWHNPYVLIFRLLSPKKWAEFQSDENNKTPLLAENKITSKESSFNFFTMFSKLALGFKEKQYSDSLLTPHKYRSLFINTLGISTVNFNLSHDDKQALMASGRQAAQSFLRRLCHKYKPMNQGSYFRYTRQLITNIKRNIKGLPTQYWVTAATEQLVNIEENLAVNVGKTYKQQLDALHQFSQAIIAGEWQPKNNDEKKIDTQCFKMGFYASKPEDSLIDSLLQCMQAEETVKEVRRTLSLKDFLCAEEVLTILKVSATVSIYMKVKDRFKWLYTYKKNNEKNVNLCWCGRGIYKPLFKYQGSKSDDWTKL
ncbi:MAG: patatin-like phospholipase family protein [Gammaproteobacteria bacterium]|nr:patatin-like phospholipase family protein [Gammaproteobacteria bacterium]